MCLDYRIPHSVFLGCDCGLWHPEDRQKAIWHHIRENSRCRSCGTRREEWDEKQGGHRHAYTADLQRCYGCEQLESKRASIEGDKQVGKGVHVILRPNPRR